MSPAQKRLRELLDQASRDRQRGLELAGVETLDDAQRSELDTIEKRSADTERQIRAARAACEDEERKATIDRGTSAPDAEERARIELRSRCTVTRFLEAGMRKRVPSGAEGELAQELGLGVGSIPMELWTPPREERQADPEKRAITPAPSSGTGVNLDTLRPHVFSPSVADRLMLDMPVVPSGAYSTATLTTPATADAVAKGAAVPETAAGFTPTQTTSHRVGARLELALEDIANVGTESFEPLLREHISLVLSSEIDNQLINGDGQNDDLLGFFARLTDPAAAPSAVTDFDGFAAAHADGIDGLWSLGIDTVSIVVGQETMRLAARTFQTATNYKGEMSAAAYAMANTAGFWTNSRMPDPATFMGTDDVQMAILCRKGRSMMPTPMRLAVCPVWFGSIQVDDPYTGANVGERYYTLSVLLGDVIITQPAAYSQIAYRVA